MNQKATQKKPSEILPSLLGCYQDILLNNTKRRRPFGFKGQLEIADRLGPAFGREMIFSLCANHHFENIARMREDLKLRILA
jgi:hypothetical protein